MVNIILGINIVRDVNMNMVMVIATAIDTSTTAAVTNNAIIIVTGINNKEEGREENIEDAEKVGGDTVTGFESLRFGKYCMCKARKEHRQQKVISPTKCQVLHESRNSR